MKAKLRVMILGLLMLPMAAFSQIITHPDSVVVYPGDTILVDVLANDYELGNDSIFVYQSSDFTVVGNRYVKVHVKNPWLGKSGGRLDTVVYTVHQVNGPHVAQGYLYIDLVNKSFDVLDINNISAKFSATGNHFWDLASNPKFFAPKDAKKVPIFNSSLWIGGRESTSGQLHLSAERYRQLGVDYHAGPVSTLYDSLYNQRWSRVWKLTTDDILHHIANYSSPSYTPIPDIAEWPAHGDTTLGQLWNMAPFYDSNNSGVYEPMAGDYPLIRGNMALFFVFNDARSPNTESGGIPLGIEVHGMAYAFDQPHDSMLNNTIFMHYDIINRSSNQYDSTWIGVYNDFDLGWAYDDFVGTHVKHGAVYVYNGTPVDGSGQPWAYGANPPVFAMQLLGGPYMDPDGLDNPNTDGYGNPLCDVSLNGLNFGDGIPDNERLGLTHSIYYIGAGAAPVFMADPIVDIDYYNYLRAIWKDGSRMLYGYNGHIATGAYGPETSFIFPNESDTCHLGTGGIPPSGPTFWSEETAGNQPGDRRIVASSGPITFHPGDRQPLDVAWVFAYDLVHNEPFDTLVDWLGKLRDLFVGAPSMFDPSVSVVRHSKPARSNLILFPNPASEIITLTGLVSREPAQYQIFSLTGQLTAAGQVSNSESINVAHLTPGLYIIRVQTGSEVISRKFIRR